MLSALGRLDAPVRDVIDAGDLYYFPNFKDARIYQQSLDCKKFRLLDYSRHPDTIGQLIDALRQQDRADCRLVADALTAQKHNFEVFYELQRQREVTKYRKLQTWHRMQKQQDRTLRKLDVYSRDETNLNLGRTRRST